MQHQPSTQHSNILWDFVILLQVCLYVFLCPYTKVEESFNTQATHDLMYTGHSLLGYDHFEFPGVVPRTFTGPAVLSTLARPFMPVLSWINTTFQIYTRESGLILMRLLLGLICVCCQAKFRNSIAKKFGEEVSKFYAIWVIAQFHLVFYMSRPLPNVFALALGKLY